jgi:hypothetical protein
MAALAAAALVAVAVVAALTRGPGGPTLVAVEPGAAGRALPPSFLGMSMEWTSVEPFGATARPAVVRLLRRLEDASGSPLALRVGGSSAEEAWWNPAGRPRPATVRHDLSPASLVPLRRLADDLRSPLSIGLNVSLGDPANALALARAARRRLGSRLEALEIGNEPDLYARARTIGPETVRRLRKKPRYTPADYSRDVARYAGVLGAGLPAPAPRLVAGSLAGSPAWVRSLPGILAAEDGRIGVVGAHRYGISSCDLDPDAPADRRLLLSGETAERLHALGPLVALAHGRGLPLWVGELNSAPCGGAPGVSDTFAATLWLTDALFTLWRLGADRADVHTWDGAVYALFERMGSRVRARPPFLGMLAFARTAPRGSRLLRVHVGDAGPVRAWATGDAAGRRRIALVNTAASGRRTVRVAVGPRRPCATVRLTTAPSLGAREGIADRPPAPLCPRGGALVLDMPAPSLAVVEIPPAG